MRLFIVYLWNYIRVLLYGKLFKKKIRSLTPSVENPLNKNPSSKTPYLTYRSNSVPSHKKRIKNRNKRKRKSK